MPKVSEKDFAEALQVAEEVQANAPNVSLPEHYRLVLDLRDARARIAELEASVARLEGRLKEADAGWGADIVMIAKLEAKGDAMADVLNSIQQVQTDARDECPVCARHADPPEHFEGCKLDAALSAWRASRGQH